MTTEEAMNDLFENRELYLTLEPKEQAKFRYIKHRFKIGGLSLEKQLEVLQDFGYIIKSELTWGKPILPPQQSDS